MRGDWIACYRGRLVAAHPDRGLLAALMTAEGLGLRVRFMGPGGRPPSPPRRRPHHPHRRGGHLRPGRGANG